MADEKITRKDIRDQLVKSLKPIVEQMRAKEAAGAEALAKSQRKKFGPGDSVRFTKKYLANTGSTQGSKRFKVIEHKDCAMCGRGEHVAVDEEGYGTDGPRHIGVSHLEHSKLKKDDGTGMTAGSDMSMAELDKNAGCAPGMDGATMMKCGPACSGGKHDHPMQKDEKPASESTPCSCGGALQILGALADRQHSMCARCGNSFSAPMAREPGGPAATADDPMGKAELPQVGSAPEKTEPGADVPDGPGKRVDAPGSGSDPKKGKMAKAEGDTPACPTCSRYPGTPAASKAEGGKFACKNCGEHFTQADADRAKGQKGLKPFGAPDAMKKGDTWNPNTGAADEAHVRGSVAAKLAPTPAPKKSPKDIRGVSAEKMKAPLAKGAMPGMGTANPPGQKARIMDRFKLGQGGTPAGGRVPLPGITAPVRAPGTPPPTPVAAMKKPTLMARLGAGKATPAGQADKEIGGFKSLAGSPTHLAAMGKAEEKAKHHFEADKATGDRPRATFGAVCRHCGEGVMHTNHEPKAKLSEGFLPKNPGDLNKATLGTGAPAAPKAPSMAAPAAGAKNTMAAAAGAKPASAKPMK